MLVTPPVVFAVRCHFQVLRKAPRHATRREILLPPASACQNLDVKAAVSLCVASKSVFLFFFCLWRSDCVQVTNALECNPTARRTQLQHKFEQVVALVEDNIYECCSEA